MDNTFARDLGGMDFYGLYLSPRPMEALRSVDNAAEANLAIRPVTLSNLTRMASSPCKNPKLVSPKGLFHPP